MIDKILRIQDSRKVIAEAGRILGEAARPHESSPADLLGLYKETYPKWRSTENSKVFLFVYLWLYDCDVLAGNRRLHRNMRTSLAAMLETATPQAISVRIRNLLFEYRVFPGFHRKCDELLRDFLGRHEGNGAGGTAGDASANGGKDAE